jgi:hypothetical protein
VDYHLTLVAWEAWYLSEGSGPPIAVVAKESNEYVAEATIGLLSVSATGGTPVEASISLLRKTKK